VTTHQIATSLALAGSDVLAGAGALPLPLRRSTRLGKTIDSITDRSCKNVASAAPWPMADIHLCKVASPCDRHSAKAVATTTFAGSGAFVMRCVALITQRPHTSNWSPAALICRSRSSLARAAILSGPPGWNGSLRSIPVTGSISGFCSAASCAAHSAEAVLRNCALICSRVGWARPQPLRAIPSITTTALILGNLRMCGGRLVIRGCGARPFDNVGQFVDIWRTPALKSFP
jgi:hypothetical protein